MGNARLCRVEDCVDHGPGRGLCSMHYQRLRRNGSLDLRSAGERFWAKVDLRGAEDCWPWTATITVSGYGQFWDGARLVRPHRWAYEAMVGPIPDGLVIDHLCRNRACCNPAHLEPVTHKENSLRGVSPNAVNARKTHCIHGHEFTEANTILRPDKAGRQCRECKRLSDRRWRLERKEISA